MLRVISIVGIGCAGSALVTVALAAPSKEARATDAPTSSVEAVEAGEITSRPLAHLPRESDSTFAPP